MNSWTYKTKIVDGTVIPQDAIGFIYEIKNIKNNKKYIGKKLLTKAATKTVNKKKVKYRKESDWKDYWSSSPWLLEMIEIDGKENFRRRILCFCSSKSQLNYAEESLQYRLKVLENDEWVNSNIRSRIFKKTIQKFDESFFNDLDNIEKSYKCK